MTQTCGNIREPLEAILSSFMDPYIVWSSTKADTQKKVSKKVVSISRDNAFRVRSKQTARCTNEILLTSS